MLRLIIPVVFLISAVPASAGQSSSPLAQFIGNWSCKGNFTANGAPIAADLRVQLDEGSGAVIFHHDDVPPGGYHALEVWMVNKGGAGLRAALSDPYSGMRWFESPGWVGGALTLTRLENGLAVEQFVYEFQGEEMRVAWSTARGGTMKLGDTLVCRHS